MGLSLHPERLRRYEDVARCGALWLAFDILTSDRPTRTR